MNLPNEKILLLFVSWTLCIISMAIMTLLVFYAPADRQTNAAIVINFLVILVTAIAGYHYGSSSGSARQAERIQEMVKPTEVRLEEIKQKGIADESIQKTVREERVNDDC